MGETVSIIITVRNGAKYLPQVIASLEKLNYKQREILFINDGSTDETGTILKNSPGVRVIETKGIGPSAARNLALKEARGNFIAFTDADCLVHPDWLYELLKGFTGDKVAAVGGDQQSPEDETPFGRKVQCFFKAAGFVADYVKTDGNDLIETSHSPTCNAMYRTLCLKQAGGFLEGLWPGEDLELDHRLKKQGWTLKYNPKAVVYHYRPDGMKRFTRMMFAYGRAQGFLVRRYGPFRLLHAVPWILLAGTVFCSFFGTAALASAGVTTGAVMYAFLLYRTKKPLQAVQLFVLSVIAVCAWHFGFFKELLFKRFRVIERAGAAPL